MTEHNVLPNYRPTATEPDLACQMLLHQCNRRVLPSPRMGLCGGWWECKINCDDPLPPQTAPLLLGLVKSEVAKTINGTEGYL